MAEGSMIALRLLFALMLVAALPSLAVAQDATGDQNQGSDQSQPDQTQPDQGDDQEQAQPQQEPASAPAPADPVEALQGLWHVDHAEGSAANDAMVGGILKIDRQAIASLSGGTCASPSFAPNPDAADPKQAGVDITCLGQTFASAYRNTDDPNTVNWSEPNLAVVLHRVTSAAAQKPADDSGDAQ
jgi:hypothetical protein